MASSTLSYPAICPGHQKGVTELSYSATADGLFFISACLDKLPMLRDGVTGDWIGTFQGHKGAVWSAKLNADATRAATASADFTVIVWDAVSGTELKTLEHAHVVKSVDFSHSGSLLATGGQDKQLRIFSLANLDAPPRVIPHPDRIRKLLWCLDDGSVITGSDEGTLRRWALADGSCVAETPVGAGILDLELSADGQVLTVAAGREVLLLEAASLKVLRRFAMAFTVEAASLHPGKRHLIAGGSDCWVHQYALPADVLSPSAAAAGPAQTSTPTETGVLKGHHGAVHCVRYSPAGDTFVSGADDAIIRIWKHAAEEPQQPKPQLEPATSPLPLPATTSNTDSG